MALLAVKLMAFILGVAATLGSHSRAETVADTEAAPAVEETRDPPTMAETFGDWQALCHAQPPDRVCAMVQRQRQRDTGQLLLSVELFGVTDKGLRGHVMLPFGLKLSRGVTIRIDGGSASAPIPFETCLPLGCVVPVVFDETVLPALRNGTTLELGTVAAADGQEARLHVSLQGFAAAEERLRALVTETMK